MNILLTHILKEDLAYALCYHVWLLKAMNILHCAEQLVIMAYGL